MLASPLDVLTLSIMSSLPTAAVPPNMRCKTPGCSRPRRQREDGGHYDYCGLSCRDGNIVTSPEGRSLTIKHDIATPKQTEMNNQLYITLCQFMRIVYAPLMQLLENSVIFQDALGQGMLIQAMGVYMTTVGGPMPMRLRPKVSFNMPQG